MRWTRMASNAIIAGLAVSLALPGGVARAKKPVRAATQTSTYTVQPGDSLFFIAQRTGTTVDALRQANGFSGDLIYPGQTIILPGSTGSGGNAPSGSLYTVQPGDTLFLIAQRHGTTIEALRQANGIVNADSLLVGQTLVLPGSGGSGGDAPSGSLYTVQPGDTLFLIAQRYGTTIEALRQANGIVNADSLLVGQTLVLPGSGGTAPPSGGPGTTYTVRAGDTLFLIAQRFGTTVESLRRANGLTTDLIYPGTVLRLPESQTPGGSGGPYVSPGIDLENAVWGSHYVISRQDYDLLARLVSAEAQGEPYSGQVAVAATVLHRLTDPRFPDTIPGIIYDVYGGVYYQYSPVENGTINYPAVPSAYRAVEDALNGVDPSAGANGFYNPFGTENTWVRSQPVTATIGNHVFFRS